MAFQTQKCQKEEWQRVTDVVNYEHSLHHTLEEIKISGLTLKRQKLY